MENAHCETTLFRLLVLFFVISLILFRAIVFCIFINDESQFWRIVEIKGKIDVRANNCSVREILCNK